MENEEVVEKQEEKTKKVNKGTPVIVILLILALLCAGGYIVYLEYFSEKESTKVEEKQEEKQKENNESVDNNTDNDTKSTVDYVFKKVNLKDKSITLANNNYSLSITDRKGIGQYLKVNGKSLDVDTYEKNYVEVKNIYIWYDILVVEYSNGLNGKVIYAYDNALNSFGKISLDNVGWYTEGQLNAESKEYITFSEKGLEIYHKNIGLGGEVISLNKQIADVSCNDAKTAYKYVPAQEKIVYKYADGKIDKGTKEIVVSLADAVCK